jgi:hypothetical protein
MVGSSRYPSIKSFNIMLSSIVVKAGSLRTPVVAQAKSGPRGSENKTRNTSKTSELFFISLGPSYSAQRGGGEGLFIHARRLFIE